MKKNGAEAATKAEDGYRLTQGRQDLKEAYRAWQDVVGGSLRTSARTQNGPGLTFRVDADTDLRRAHRRCLLKSFM